MRGAVKKLRRLLWTSRRSLFILVAALMVTELVKLTPMFADASRGLMDVTQRLTAPVYRFDDAVIVDIDEESMAIMESQLGAWPYHRGVYALITDFLSRAGAQTIVFDILFRESRDGDEELVEILSDKDNVYLASRGQEHVNRVSSEYLDRLSRLAWHSRSPQPVSHWKDFQLASDRFIRPTGPAGTGIISAKPDLDGVLRRVPLLHEAHGHYLPSLPLAALQPVGSPTLLEYDNSGPSIRVGEYDWPVDDRGQVILNYPRNADAVPIVPFYRVVLAALGSEDARIDVAAFKGKTVFIGSSAAVLGDYVFVPVLGRMAGLGVLALSYENLKHGLMLKAPTYFWELVLSLLAAVLPLLWSNQRRVSEPRIFITGLFGLFAAATLHVALLGFFRQQTELVGPLLLGILVLSVQLSLRMKTLGDERTHMYYDKLAADEANSLKSRFLSHMTHELRTPLTAIMGYNRMLDEPDLKRVDQHKWIGVIDHNCQHLLGLINNLLDQSKIEAGQMSVELAPLRIRELVGGVLDTMNVLAEQRGLRLKADFADGLPEGLCTDETRLRQILVNLTGNGLKFTEQGGVTLGLEWRDDMLTVRVADTGPGMDEVALSRIFESFQQADNTIARKHGGTGLGLTISRNLAQLLGGDLHAESVLGQGSSFVLSVAAKEAELPRSVPDVATASLPAVAAESLSRRVLVVDDSEDIRNLVAIYLKKMKLDVSKAEDGVEGLELARQSVFDLVILDRQMPGMDGFEVASTLRAEGYAGGLLAMTGESGSEVADAARLAGFDDYLVKPVQRDKLLERVHSLLAKVGTELER